MTLVADAASPPMSTIEIRTDHQDGVTTVRALIRHPMTLPARDELGDITLPAHFIERVVCELNGTVVLTAHWGTGISKNPYIAFAVGGSKPGDQSGPSALGDGQGRCAASSNSPRPYAPSRLPADADGGTAPRSHVRSWAGSPISRETQIEG